VSYTLRHAVAACPRPAPPALSPLDETRRVSERRNLAVLLRNVDLMAAHIADQDVTLDCYERQAGTLQTQGGE
jgi:hypothetical protein